jgi:hypothetical protein
MLNEESVPSRTLSPTPLPAVEMDVLNILALNGTLYSWSKFAGLITRWKKKYALVTVSVLFIGIFPNAGYSQTYGTATNAITVKVQAITIVQITGSIVNLTVSGSNAIAGQNQMMTTDQTSTLSWGINSSLKKITVNTSLAAPKFTLQLVAVSPTVGTAASQVTLSTTANDLVLNIGRSSGSCGLLYTAVALASQGTGTDSHTITFTVVTQ